MAHHTIALVGCGNVGTYWHLPAYKAVENLSVVAVCDVNADAAAAAANKFNIPKYCSDVEEMLSQDAPEILALALPPFLHKEYVEKALNAGCHTIVEKPLAPSMEDVRHIVALANASAKKVIVDQNWRYSKISRTAKKIIAEGLIGEPYYIEMRQYSYAYPGFVNTYVGKGDKAAFFEMGPHIVDLVRYWFGAEAQSVYAKMPKLPHIEHPADWLDVVIINFPDERTAYIVDDWGATGKEFSTLLKGRINGSKGSIRFEFKENGQNILEVCTNQKEGVVSYDVTEKNWPWNINILLTRHLIEAIEKNTDVENSVFENRGTLEIIFAAYESAKEGAVKEVNL